MLAPCLVLVTHLSSSLTKEIVASELELDTGHLTVAAGTNTDFPTVINSKYQIVLSLKISRFFPKYFCYRLNMSIVVLMCSDM